VNSPIDEAYTVWQADPSPSNLASVVDHLDPVLTAEVSRYSGPNSLLKPKAKGLAIKSIRSYDPTRGAKLTSWVTTGLQPLSRYGQQRLSQVRVPEAARQQAAEIARVTGELTLELGDAPSNEAIADRVGISATRVKKLRDSVLPVMSDGAFELSDPGAASGDPSVSNDHSAQMQSASEMVYAALDERDKLIFDLRTGSHGQEPLDAMAVARRLKVTPAYISQRAARIATQITETSGRV